MTEPTNRPSKRAGRMKPLKNDVDFIDPKTGLKVCSFNQCVKKFDRIEQELITKTRRDGGEYQVVTQFHVCNECGRRHRNMQDKFDSWGNFLSVVAGNEPELGFKKRVKSNE